jgi:hypothetical protein
MPIPLAMGSSSGKAGDFRQRNGVAFGIQDAEEFPAVDRDHAGRGLQTPEYRAQPL